MSRLPITIATWDYDRVRALVDGRVRVEGCDVNYVTMPVEELFERAFFHGEFEVAEIGFSPFLIALSRGASTLCGGSSIPVAHVSAFSSVYSQRPRHPATGRPAWQAHRRTGISDVGGDVVSRLLAGRVRHCSLRTSAGCRRVWKFPDGAISFRSICRTDFRSQRGTMCHYPRCWPMANSTAWCRRGGRLALSADTRRSGGCFPTIVLLNTTIFGALAIFPDHARARHPA